jgi:hypothetical protein
MSDGLTDVARDQRRGRCYDEYLESIRVFLGDPTDENRQKALLGAKNTDAVPSGYFGGRTELESKAEALLADLQGGDKSAWAKFLFSLKDSRDFRIFKEISPWKDQLLIAVDYGCGFVHFHGDIEPFMRSIINGKDMRTYDADDYLVVLPKIAVEETEVFWVRCGASGPGIPTDRPRPARG